MLALLRVPRGSIIESLKLFTALVAAALAPVLAAQTKDKPDADKPASGSEVMRLSKFEVTSTSDKGYLYNNSAGAFRTNQPLLDIPQSAIVITQDMIKDIGTPSTTDIMAYFGMPAFEPGQQPYLRGGVTLPFQDDMPTGTIPFADNGILDSYEVIKGAAQVLYLSSGLNGIILEHTKKPLPYNYFDIDTSINSFGSIRQMDDFSGPIGTIGDANISYRLTAIGQTGKSYFVHNDEPHLFILPQFQVDFKNSTLRVYYERSQISRVENSNGLITPSGGVYEGNGYKYAEGLINGGSNQFTSNVGYVSLNTNVGESWQNEFKGAFRHSTWWGTNVLPEYINWDTNQLGLVARLIGIKESDLTVMDDLQGNYKWGITDNTSVFGFMHDEVVNPVKIWGPSTLPASSPFAAGFLYEPLNQRADAHLVAPAPTDFSGATNRNAESESKINNTLAYYSHSMNIGQYVTLAAGWTIASSSSLSISNINVQPVVPQNEVSGTQNLHRYGIILKPIKGLSLYALESSIFSTPNPYDLDINGNLLPNVLGTNREIGAKGNLFGGKVNFNFGIFDMKTTNLPRLAGISAVTGRGYWQANGTTDSKGADADIALNLTPGWQLTASWFRTPSSIAYSQPMNTWSLFTKYAFQKDSHLSGLSIGGGVTRLDGLYVNLFGWPGTKTAFEQATGFIKAKPGVPIKLFASYHLDRHWTFMVSCDNVTDQHYAIASGFSAAVDLSNPRLFTLDVDYKF